jgi:hypothetical protein
MTALTSDPAQNSTGRPMARGLAKPAPRPDRWHEIVQDLVARAEANLWDIVGIKARAFLLKQGLREDTIRNARLGYWPEESHLRGIYHDSSLWIPRGILIPWWEKALVEALRVRRPVKPRTRESRDSRDNPEPVSVLVRGSRRILYPGPDVIRTGRPILIVDDEIDALLLAQQLAELASVVVLGFAHRPPLRVLGAMLGGTWWVVSTFGEEPGREWIADLDRYFRVLPPDGWGASWVEAHQAGLNVTAWWTEVFEKRKSRSSPLIQPRTCLPVPAPAGHPLLKAIADEPEREQERPFERPMTEHGRGTVIDWSAADHATLRVVQKLANENGDWRAIPPGVLEAIDYGRFDDSRARNAPTEEKVHRGHWRCRNLYCLHKTG